MKKNVTLFVGTGALLRQRMYHAAKACAEALSAFIIGAVEPPRTEGARGHGGTS